MARITDEYVKMQKRCRPNIDASHRCIFRCPQCIRQKTSSQEQIRRSFDLEEDQFKKILDLIKNVEILAKNRILLLFVKIM